MWKEALDDRRLKDTSRLYFCPLRRLLKADGGSRWEQVLPPKAKRRLPLGKESRDSATGHAAQHSLWALMRGRAAPCRSKGGAGGARSAVRPGWPVRCAQGVGGRLPETGFSFVNGQSVVCQGRVVRARC